MKTTAALGDIQPLPFDPSKLRGLSARLIESHYRNNYSRAAGRLVEIQTQLAALDWDKTAGFVVNGLKREELIASNSVVLHELYFSTLGGDGVLQAGGTPAEVTVGLRRDFGSVEAWRREFTALALGLAGGAGWGLLSWSHRQNRLINQWASDHSQLLAGATPILALDMYEHSYHLDFGADAKAYVAAFMDNIDWDGVAARHKAVVADSTAALSMTAEAAHDSPQLKRIDVRRDGAYAASNEVIAGSVWRDPVRVDEWAHELNGQVLVYCVHGNAVSRSTAARLRRAGVSAFFLAGGIENWKAQNRPLVHKLACATALSAQAQTENFDNGKPGRLPEGWECGVTGKGSPRWAVITDETAPSGPNVLQQIGEGTFPWCVNRRASLLDGFVEVKFKPLRGQQDQAGGVVWRWTDGANYYVARANALESNVSLYYTANGKRNTIEYVNAPVPANTWHTLRVEFAAKQVKVILNGKTYVEVEDSHIPGPGAVGVWTKADSVTSFDDFSWGANN
jgi:Fe-Mn family superoxide dismutase